MSAAILKAEAAMDRMYRYQAAFYDFTRKPYLLGRDTLLDRLDPPEHGSILEVASGTGRNLIKASRLYPTCRLFGFDVANVMVEKARNQIQKRGLQTLIAVSRGDATDFHAEAVFSQCQFDRVYISYALSMIPDWQTALRMALSITKADGSLSIVDFGSAVDQPHWIRPLLLSWLKLFGVVPQPDLPVAMITLGQQFHRPVTIEKLWGGYTLLVTMGPVHHADGLNR